MARYITAMKSFGRPKKINPQTPAAKRFLDLYLDPLNTAQSIIDECRISLATFYNYEKELALPQLRVAIGCPGADLPYKKALQSFKGKHQELELNIVRQLSRSIGARIKLIPTPSADIFAGPYAVKTKAVDFAISSLTITKERRKIFYFSDNYLDDDPPQGVLFRKKHQFTLFPQGLPHLTLGVTASSVHAEHAMDRLQNEFRVKTYRTASMTFQALIDGRVDYVLFHPVWLKILPQFAPLVEIASKPIYYKTESGMLFHADSEHLRIPINRAISQKKEQKSKADLSFPLNFSS